MAAILIIGDDHERGPALVAHLTHAGFLVETAPAGKGIQMALEGAYTFVILAVLKSGGQTSLDLLRQLRQRVSTPLVMLLGRNEEADRILALEQRADECLSQPFSLREVVARIQAILRRSHGGTDDRPPQPDALLRVGDILLDARRRLVRQAGGIVNLTAREFELLEKLLRQAGAVVRREEILPRVPARRKLGRLPRDQARIKTLRNIGYQYVLPSAGAGEASSVRG